jgi:hypothetical protein
LQTAFGGFNTQLYNCFSPVSTLNLYVLQAARRRICWVDFFILVPADYAPFNVDVTTNPPAQGTSPSTYVRIMIGGNCDRYTPVGGPAGGVAWVSCNMLAALL